MSVKDQHKLIKEKVQNLVFQQYGIDDLTSIKSLVVGAMQFYDIDESLDRIPIDKTDSLLSQLLLLHRTKPFDTLFDEEVLNEEYILQKLKDVSNKLI